MLKLVDETGAEYRVSAYRPREARSACVFVNSGRVSSFGGGQPESRLVARLREQLHDLGVATFDLDLPARSSAGQPAGRVDVDARLYRVKQLLSHPVFHEFVGRFAVAGICLGGHVALALLSDSRRNSPVPDAVVLISTVIDAPTTIYASTRNIFLIYGSRDHIAYVSDDSALVTPIRPSEYSVSSAANLIVRRSQKVSIRILEGLGHALQPVVPDHADPMADIIDIIHQTFPDPLPSVAQESFARAHR